jgi:ankyrin repeat protein
VIKALLKGGADVKLSSDQQVSPLMMKIRTNPDPEIIRLLLESGSDLSQRNSNGKTAYDLASEKSGKLDAEIMELLHKQ